MKIKVRKSEAMLPVLGTYPAGSRVLVFDLTKKAALRLCEVMREHPTGLILKDCITEEYTVMSHPDALSTCRKVSGKEGLAVFLSDLRDEMIAIQTLEEGSNTLPLPADVTSANLPIPPLPSAGVFASNPMGLPPGVAVRFRVSRRTKRSAQFCTMDRWIWGRISMQARTRSRTSTVYWVLCPDRSGKECRWKVSASQLYPVPDLIRAPSWVQQAYTHTTLKFAVK